MVDNKAMALADDGAEEGEGLWDVVGCTKASISTWGSDRWAQTEREGGDGGEDTPS